MEVAYRKRCSLERMLYLSREMRDTDKERSKYWDCERLVLRLSSERNLCAGLFVTVSFGSEVQQKKRSDARREKERCEQGSCRNRREVGKWQHACNQ